MTLKFRPRELANPIHVSYSNGGAGGRAIFPRLPSVIPVYQTAHPRRSRDATPSTFLEPVTDASFS